MSAPVQNHPCAACGQLDDHPMAHLWMSAPEVDASGKLTGRSVPGSGWTNQETGVEHFDPSFHHDCIPHYLLLRVQQDAHRDHLTKIVEKAKSGVHGDELRAFIQKNAPKVEA